MVVAVRARAGVKGTRVVHPVRHVAAVRVPHSLLFRLP